MKRKNTDRRWKGYDFDELQEQIVLNDARIFAQKMVLDRRTESIRHMGGGATSFFKIAFSLFDYIDYITLGVNLFRKLRRLFRKSK